jgi:hypothetical protein
MKKKFPMKQMNTGQKFPEGVDLALSQCVQCGRNGKTALMSLRFMGRMVEPNRAECLADFVMSPAEVYAQAGGEFRRLGGEMP